MKKIVLVSFLFAIVALSKTNAQIVNNGFENWVTDTSYFNGFNGFFKPDTFAYNEPVDWTSTNFLSGADTFGNIFLVAQSNHSNSGSSSVKVITDTLKTVGTPLGPRKLTIPGLLLNGTFPLNIANNLLIGGTISPSQVPGAGQAFTQRLANLKGYVDYTPVFNDSTQTMDSCIVWAVLKKGSLEVAHAIYKSGDTTGGFQSFSVPFIYTACDDPDTLVILIASSVPNFTSILSGTTKLVPGSVLYVDDLTYDTLAANYNYPPIAVNDLDTTTKNVSKNILVKLNDADCNDPLSSLTITVASQPVSGGTATQIANNLISYAPGNNYVGLDSFSYTLSDGVNTSTPAHVRVLVLATSGVNTVSEIPVTVYPVPANNELTIQFENASKANVKVFDMLGNVVYTSVISGNTNTISTSAFANGVYVLQVFDNYNNLISKAKFSVSR
jgi:hypothetical protein